MPSTVRWQSRGQRSQRGASTSPPRATLALAAIVQLAVARWLGRPLWPTVLAPLGWLTFVFAALRSMVLTLRRGGITWRGTHYPLAALRRGRRYVHA